MAAGKRRSLEISLAVASSGIDDHGKTKAFLNKTNLFTVNWIAYTGNGLTMSGFLCNQTAEQV